MPARAQGRLVVVVVLVLAAALAVTAYFLSSDRQAMTDETAPSGQAEGPADTEADAQAGAAVGRDNAGSDEAAVARSTGQSRTGRLEIEIEPSGARLAVIGPDRFVHASTHLRSATLESLPSGDYVLLGAMDGYAPAVRELHVTAGENHYESLSLRQTGGR